MNVAVIQCPRVLQLASLANRAVHHAAATPSVRNLTVPSARVLIIDGPHVWVFFDTLEFKFFKNRITGYVDVFKMLLDFLFGGIIHTIAFSVIVISNGYVLYSLSSVLKIVSWEGERKA